MVSPAIAMAGSSQLLRARKVRISDLLWVDGTTPFQSGSPTPLVGFSRDDLHHQGRVRGAAAHPARALRGRPAGLAEGDGRGRGAAAGVLRADRGAAQEGRAGGVDA